jgi:hypothetical protein
LTKEQIIELFYNKKLELHQDLDEETEEETEEELESDEENDLKQEFAEEFDLKNYINLSENMKDFYVDFAHENSEKIEYSRMFGYMVGGCEGHYSGCGIVNVTDKIKKDFDEFIKNNTVLKNIPVGIYVRYSSGN